MPEMPGPLDPYIPPAVRLRAEADWYREHEIFDTANLLDEAADLLDEAADVIEDLLRECA